MSQTHSTIKEQVLNWVDGLHTEVTLTDELKEEIYNEVDNIPDSIEAVRLLKEVSHVLNMIPNKKNVGRNGESSYDMASKVDTFLKEYKLQNGDF